MPNTNQKLNKARKQKRDELYTCLSDIEHEVWHYEKFFRGKIILCNCDDPFESNFFKYFAMNFNHLGLKKLIATCYNGSPIQGAELSLFEEKESSHPYKVELTSVPDMNNDGTISIEDVEAFMKSSSAPVEFLQENGDFRSEECINLLKQADIVVTNPPFSLFREYVTQLMEYNKKFLIIGHQNAIKYKEIFPYILRNELWLGYGFKRNCAHFINKYYEDTASDADHREGMIRVPGVMWYTNLDTSRRHEPFDFYRNYTENDYPKYENYDAIEVSKSADIPDDYYGKMGVPITFLQKYNPDEFELLGVSHAEAGPIVIHGKGRQKPGVFYIRQNGNLKSVYERLVIRRRRK